MPKAKCAVLVFRALELQPHTVHANEKIRRCAVHARKTSVEIFPDLVLLEETQGAEGGQILRTVIVLTRTEHTGRVIRHQFGHTYRVGGLALVAWALSQPSSVCIMHELFRVYLRGSGSGKDCNGDNEQYLHA